MKVLGAPPRQERMSNLRGLDGAVKVCARYGAGESGKKRCLQWVPGPGYAEGPLTVGTGTGDKVHYYIKEVRDGAELGRRYRYRKSLPYNPLPDGRLVPLTPQTEKLALDAQAKFATLPSSVQNEIIKIVDRPANPEVSGELVKIRARSLPSGRKALPPPEGG